MTEPRTKADGTPKRSLKRTLTQRVDVPAWLLLLWALMILVLAIPRVLEGP